MSTPSRNLDEMRERLELILANGPDGRDSAHTRFHRLSGVMWGGLICPLCSTRSPMRYHHALQLLTGSVERQPQHIPMTVEFCRMLWLPSMDAPHEIDGRMPCLWCSKGWHHSVLAHDEGCAYLAWQDEAAALDEAIEKVSLA